MLVNEYQYFEGFCYLHLQCVQLLLCDDLKLGGYTRVVSRQRLGKYVPTATNRRATMEVQLETRCF
jgi:hypothetical protein